MKEVYIVYGTLENENYPDYSIHGVFENYEDAEQFMISITVSAMDKFESESKYRKCEYNDEGLLSYIFEDWYYRVFMKLEKAVVR